MGANIQLRFPAGITTEPVVCHLTRLFDLDFNITSAQISSRREGYLILELLGSPENCRKAVDYLQGRGVEVTPVSQCIRRDEGLCVNCGMCTSLCPTSALRMDTERRLAFDKERCTVCTLCTRVCPVHAMRVDMDI